MRLSRPVTLTARLVVTAVVLVAAVSVLIGGATWLAIRASPSGQLDDQVQGALARAERGPVGGFGLPPDDGESSGGPDGDGRRPDDVRGQGVGTLTASLDEGVGDVIVGGDRGTTTRVALDQEALADLDAVPADGEVHDVRVDGLGSFRVAVEPGGDLAVGLPTRDIDRALTDLLITDAALASLGVLAAGAAGTVVVRRQLRPLREVAGTAHRVAELPLAAGEVEVRDRVPERLTDDRTEVGRVGAALNTLLAHLEESLTVRHRSEQQVRQFVADASHELRTPLATIQGYAELAQQHPDDAAAVRQVLGRVQVESGRMAGLVEDLLLLARLDAGRPLARSPVDLTRLLLEAVVDAQVRAPDHAWRLDLPDHPVEVTGDDQRLHQVVSNLLANAARHTPPGRTVTVSGDAAGLAVHDDGPGFEPDLAARAFERFTRGDSARTREGGSSGLGLALVDAIVTAHGGRVSLASRPGDTTVRVDLPGG